MQKCHPSPLQKTRRCPTSRKAQQAFWYFSPPAGGTLFMYVARRTNGGTLFFFVRLWRSADEPKSRYIYMRLIAPARKRCIIIRKCGTTCSVCVASRDAREKKQKKAKGPRRYVGSGGLPFFGSSSRKHKHAMEHVLAGVL